ncbi:MAG: hypothetical protein RLZZ15_763 [Verrucomicrobiota bacterium]|jgi:hypothetical protein
MASRTVGAGGDLGLAADGGRAMTLRMNVRFSMRVFVVVGSLVLAGCVRVPSADETLRVHDDGAALTLSVPVSKLALTLPKAGLVSGNDNAAGTPRNPRYFIFRDQSRGELLIVSGWFESAGRFTSVKKLWEGDVASWSANAILTPKNVSFQKVGEWETVAYDNTVPSGTNTHVRAHVVKSGTWIDLHLSLTSRRSREECQKRMAEFLERVRVTERS